MVMFRRHSASLVYLSATLQRCYSVVVVVVACVLGCSFQSCIGFTKKQDNQIKQTCYAQASQIRAVRKKMCDIMSEEAGKCDLRELVLKL